MNFFKKLFSKFKYIIAFLLLIGSILAIIFSSLELSKKEDIFTTQTDSISLKFKVAVAVDTKNEAQNKQLNTYENKLKRLKRSAAVFEQNLLEQNIRNDGVQYELKAHDLSLKDSDNNQYHGWIFTNLQGINAKIATTFDNEKYYLPVNEIFYQSLSSNFFELISFSKNKNNDPNYEIDDKFNNNLLINNYLINFENAFINKTSDSVANENNSSNRTEGVVLPLNKMLDVSDFQKYKKGKVDEDSIYNVDESATNKPDNYNWYLVKDLDKLINRLNYLLVIGSFKHSYDGPNEYQKFASSNQLPKYIYDHNSGINEPINYLNFLYEQFSADEKAWLEVVFPSSNDFSSVITSRPLITKESIFQIYNAWSIAEQKEIINDASSNIAHKYYVGEQFNKLVDPYIIDIINYDNYHLFFPQVKEIKDKEISNSINTNEKLLVSELKLSSKLNSIFFADSNAKLLEKIKNNYSAPLYNPAQSTNENHGFFLNYSLNNAAVVSKASNPWNFYGISNKTSLNEEQANLNSIGLAIRTPSPILEPLSKLSTYNAVFLTLGVILFLVAIIVSVLYRIPGFIAALTVILSTSFTSLILIASGLPFTFANLFALMSLIILTTSSLCIFLNRLKLKIKQKFSIFNSNIDTFKKATMPIIDMHIISLIIGLVLVFMNINNFGDFGYTFVLGSLVSLVTCFIFFYLFQWLFTNTTFFWKEQYYFHFQKNIDLIKQQSYQKIISWKFGAIALAIVLTIFTIIVILISTIGFLNTIWFNDSSVVAIYGQVDINKAKSLLSNYEFISANNELILFRKSGVVDQYDNLINMLSDQLMIAKNQIFVGTSINATSFKILENAIYAILISTSFIALYSLIRYGWYSILVIFILTILSTLFGISINYLVYIPINAEISFVIIFVFVKINYYATIFISNLKIKIIYKEIFTKEEIKNFIITNIKQTNALALLIWVFVIISMIMASSLFSPTYIFSMVLITIGFSFGLITTTLLFPAGIYSMMILRQKIVKNIFQHRFSEQTKKYDAIDEELVDNINNFRMKE